MKLRKMNDFARDDRGVVAIFIAFTIPIIVVVAAFAIDYGYVVSVQAELRTASDESALAAVVSIDDEATAQATALEYAAKNMPADTNGTVLTESDIILGHWSTSSSTFSAGDSPINAIQITTRRSSANGNAVDLFFGPLVSVPTFDVQSKTVAALLSTSEDGVYCFVALSSSADDAMGFSTTDTQLDNCGIISNSSSESALSFGGASQVQITNAEVAVVGGIEISGNPNLDFDNTPTTGASSISDPFGDIDVPAFSGCDNGPSPAVVVADTTFTPGVYCGGLSVAGNAAVDFEPGADIILDGDLRFQGSSEITGDEVTFVFTGTTAGDIGSLTITGNSTIDFTAPDKGDFAGIIMYQDRDASTSGDNRISGGAEVTIDGAFYFPRQEIVITGNATIQGDEECASFVGRLVSVGGSSQVQIECDTSSDFAILLSTGSKMALLRE